MTRTILALVALTALGCTQTQQAIEHAQSAKAAAEASLAAVRAQQEQARAHCDSAIETLTKVQAVAPYACGLVAAQEGSPKVALDICAQREHLPKAVRQVVQACGLITGR